MKKINFTSLPKGIFTPLSCKHKAGPDSVFKADKQWSEKLRIKSRAKRIIFSTGARTCKMDRLKEMRIMFVLTKNT